MSLTDHASRLANIAVSTEHTFEDAMEAARHLLESAEQDTEGVDDALRILLEAVRAEDAERAGIGAIVCGSLIENGGGDPRIAGEHVVERFDAVSKTALQYVEACGEYFRENVLSDDAVCEVCGPGEAEDDIMMPQVRQMVSQTMPEGESAWIALDLFCRPAVAVLQRDAALRQHFGRDLDLINRAGLLAQHQSSAYYVWALLSVLDDEQLLVIDPSTSRGFDVRIKGVGDNFQLHLLLAAELYGGGHLDGDDPPEPEVVAAMQGSGPVSVDDFVVGYWNLYNWCGLSPDGELPDGYFDQGQRYWIWNEGVPADILTLKDRRIVLLGPSPFVRPWQPTRLFDQLEASLVVERELAPEVVEEWLETIRSASADLRDEG